MDALAECTSELARARARLVEELREHALVIGEVTLTSGARRRVLRGRQARDPAARGVHGARACWWPSRLGRAAASAVGGMPVSAIPVACAALAAPGRRRRCSSCAKSARSTGCSAGSRGRRCDPGERCVIVEDVVTTGGSTIEAIERVRERGPDGLRVSSACSTAWRAAARRSQKALGDDAPYTALSTIDEVYPERPDRCLTAGCCS